MSQIDSSLLPLGATITPDGVRFSVWSSAAEKIWVCLFDAQDRETRVPLVKGEGNVFSAQVPGIHEGQRYGLRADGVFDPHKGLWFDPDKLLMDPYAVEIDHAWIYDARLGSSRGQAGDTAQLVPKAIVSRLPEPIQKTHGFAPGGLVYELQVRALTMRHPDVPHELRGTVAALAHPAIIAHLKKIGVSAVELMPVTAWMDERHLPPLGLTNAWGYNPVTFMALDPRLCPGGLAELRATTQALHEAGISVILDLVFNHTAESDTGGPTVSLRGLDANAYYRRYRGKLVNDTGTGNTVACDHPVVARMVMDTLRHFVQHAGIDGFRFDLAPILGRNKQGFSADAPLLKAMREDPVLADVALIAEPWDIGAGGYQLGNFGSPWLEWNDRARDDFRRFWRGDSGMIGALATRLAGSSDIFQRDGQTSTRSVNFIAAHDGFSLADMVAYERKHNEANGEKNRDGHNDNHSWNNGVEGVADDADVLLARRRDLKALLATLFASRGTIMITAGDEFGRTQQGNNNAYCQDNEITWLDWQGRDVELEDYVARLAAVRFGQGFSKDPPSALPGISPSRGEIGSSNVRSQIATANEGVISPREGEMPGRAEGGISQQTILTSSTFLSGQGSPFPDVEWLTESGEPMNEQSWNDPGRNRLTMLLASGAQRLAVLINGDRRATAFQLPQRDGFMWRRAASADRGRLVDGRSVEFMVEAGV